MQPTSTGTPAPGVGASRLVTRGRSRNLRVASQRSLLSEGALPVIHRRIERDPGRRTDPVRDGRPLSRSPNFVSNTKGRAFRRLATISNDFGAALVDEPMAQLHECATRLLKLLGPGYRAGTCAPGVARANGTEPEVGDHGRTGAWVLRAPNWPLNQSGVI